MFAKIVFEKIRKKDFQVSAKTKKNVQQYETIGTFCEKNCRTKNFRKFSRKCALLPTKLPKYVHDILFTTKCELFSQIFEQNGYFFVIFYDFHENL